MRESYGIDIAEGEDAPAHPRDHRHHRLADHARSTPRDPSCRVARGRKRRCEPEQQRRLPYSDPGIDVHVQLLLSRGWSGTAESLAHCRFRLVRRDCSGAMRKRRAT